MLTLTVKNAYTYISGISPGQFPHCVYNSLLYIASVDNETKKGKITKSLLDKDNMRFPTGTLYKVTRALKANNIEYEIKDETEYLDKNPIVTGIHLRPYQEDSIRHFTEGDNDYGIKGRGILDLATGAGKTTIAIQISAIYNQPTIFFVHTKDLLFQAKKKFKESFGAENVGSAGGGIDEDYIDEDGNIKQFVVAMIQSLAYHGKKKGYLVKKGYEKLMATRKVAFFDECHHSQSDTWFWVGLECPASIRCGLSGTPWSEVGNDILLEAVSGPVVSKITAQELVSKGWLSKPDIKLYLVDSEIDPKFYDKDDEENSWHRLYKVGIVFNPHRNAIIVSAVQKALKQNKSVLVIVNHKIHGALIVSLINKLLAEEFADNKNKAIFINSTFASKERDLALELFRTGKIKVMVGTSVHPQEVIWVRNKITKEIHIIKIGEFSKLFNFNIKYNVNNTEHQLNCSDIKDFEAFSEDNYGNFSWKTIKAIIKHKNNKKNALKIVMDNGAINYPTSDHSLIGEDYSSIPPIKGNIVKNMNHFILTGQVEEIDVIETLLRSSLSKEDLNTIEVIFEKIDRKFIYKLQHIRNGTKFHSKSKNKINDKLLPYGIPDPDNKKLFQQEFDNIVWYEKGFFRCNIQDFQKAKYIKIIPHYLSIRRSRSNFTLPTKISLNNGLPFLLGAFAAEGSLTIEKNSSQFRVSWACKEDCVEDERIGFNDKTKIRKNILEKIKSTFNFDAREDKNGIILSSKLAYAFFDGLKIKLNNRSKLRGQKCVPPIIWECNLEKQKEFLFGYFCGDGHLEKIGNYSRMTFVSVSYELICGIKKILENLGSKNITIRDSIPGSPKNQIRYNLCVKDDPFYYQTNNSIEKKYQSHIKSATTYHSQPEWVYDISVEETERFFSGTGILLHNTLFDEGVDLPIINTCIMAAGGKSERRTIQRLGRALRLGENCLHKTAKKNCNLFGNDTCPFRCIELQKNNLNYDESEVEKVHEFKMNYFLRNIKHYSSTEWEVVVTRTLYDLNSKEILQVYNQVESSELLGCNTGIVELDEVAKTINKLYGEVGNALQNGNIGEDASILKGTIVLQDGKAFVKDPTPDQKEWVKSMTEKSIDLFVACCKSLAINEVVSNKCPSKTFKNTVELIDFMDSSDKILRDHSMNRLRTYDDEGHLPMPGSLDEFSEYPLVKKTEGIFLGYEQMMENYGQYLSKDIDDDKNI